MGAGAGHAQPQTMLLMSRDGRIRLVAGIIQAYSRIVHTYVRINVFQKCIVNWLLPCEGLWDNYNN
jgi:hypothetical protein